MVERKRTCALLSNPFFLTQRSKRGAKAQRGEYRRKIRVSSSLRLFCSFALKKAKDNSESDVCMLLFDMRDEVAWRLQTLREATIYFVVNSKG